MQRSASHARPDFPPRERHRVLRDVLNIRVIHVRPPAPELSADYLGFFDTRAFSDGSPYFPCYCTAFNMSAEQIRSEFFCKSRKLGGGVEGWKQALRETAERMVRRGEIKGYLAYDGATAVGWCNANDRQSYWRTGEFSLDDEIRDDRASCRAGTVKSIVCFEIAPGWRGRGIASALLARVLDDARQDGYERAETYPVQRTETSELDFTGPVRLYEKFGFVPKARRGKTLIMQKVLHNGKQRDRHNRKHRLNCPRLVENL